MAVDVICFNKGVLLPTNKPTASLSEEDEGQTIPSWEQIMGLCIIVNTALISSANFLTAAYKARGVLLFTKRSCAGLMQRVFVALYNS